MNWLCQPPEPPSTAAFAEAEKRQNTLTKPPGSLGRLEQIAQQFCAWQSSQAPRLETINIVVFAGDHGVCAQGISAFPQQVTVEMLRNFANGGAAINVLAKEARAQLRVVNMGTATPVHLEGVLDCQVAPGTQDFTLAAAMTAAECSAALHHGAELAAGSEPSHLNIGGEMGIGNTTAAAAIFAALLDLPPEQVAGPGTGLDNSGVQHKSAVIEKALALHNSKHPLEVLQNLGGLEIAALTGYYIRSAQMGVPVLVDGFICTAAALVATRLNPQVSDWLLFAHSSAETAHARVLQTMGVQPLLDLSLRLGEGTGAALCIPILRAACALHRGMATFEQAGISGG